MTRFPRAAPWLVFAAVSVLYIGSAYPTIAPRDSADLAAAAMTLSVAHPPGYPLYSILGKAWIFIFPLGNPAYRLNLLSAFCGALSAAASYWLLESWIGFLPALGGALVFALSAPLWKFSLLEEMYSMSALFAVALLWLAQGREETSARRFYLSALLFGLAVVNHQTMALLAPALALLWAGKLKIKAAAAGALFFSLGIALYAFIWVRLGDARLAWEILTRAEYGSLTLSSHFSRGISAPLAGGLLAHFFVGLGRATSWLALALACGGAPELWGKGRKTAVALALVFLMFGPAYFLLTRFDVSGWIARSVLEPAFLLPSLIVAVAAGAGIARFSRGPLALGAAAVIAGAGLWVRGAEMDHRDDFSAYDYAKDLRRFIPPGAAAIVAGDTAQFSWKYLELTHGAGTPPRQVIGSLEYGLRQWLEGRLRQRPAYVVGLPKEEFGPLGLEGNPHSLYSEGPVVQVGGTSSPETDWQLSVWRTPRAAERGESYARDLQVSYAYAHFLDGSLAERRGAPEAVVAPHYREAAWLYPENYRISLVYAKDSQ